MVKFHKLTEDNKPEVGKDVLILVDKYVYNNGVVEPNPHPYCYLVERDSEQHHFYDPENGWTKEDYYVERYGEQYGGWRASEIGGWIYLDEFEYEIEGEG